VQGTWYKVRGRKFRVQVSRYQVNALGKRMEGKRFMVLGTRFKVKALGKRLKAKGSRRKRGSDAIIRFKVQPCLYPPP
jgi:hypothetical protein